MRRRSIASILALSSLLAGCASLPEKLACPPLKTYTLDQQKHLAAEFGALPADVRAVVNDYKLLRDECRAF
jgi:ABC-type uncharacterized transport system auxiliary subunit